jgi:hypothetical protein
LISVSARACRSVGVLGCEKVASVPMTRIVLRVRFASSSKKALDRYAGLLLQGAAPAGLVDCLAGAATGSALEAGVVVLEEQLGPTWRRRQRRYSAGMQISRRERTPSVRRWWIGRTSNGGPFRPPSELLGGAHDPGRGELLGADPPGAAHVDPVKPCLLGNLLLLALYTCGT